MAPGGQVCRRFRAAFLGAVRGLVVSFDQTHSHGLGLTPGSAAQVAAVSVMTQVFVERATNLAGVLPRLGHLCSFGLRFVLLPPAAGAGQQAGGNLLPPWVPPLLHQEMLGTAARVPSLREVW